MKQPKGYYMANWWDELAVTAQREITREDEGSSNFDGLESYRIKRAILHTRYDMMMVIAYLSAANRQLNDLKRIGWSLIALFVILLITLWQS